MGAWLCNMRLLSSHNSFEGPSILRCAVWHSQNQYTCIVTVPDVSVFHHKESIVFQLGAWLCKHETALPHTIHLETIRPPVCCSGTHRINTRSNVTVPDVSVFHYKESLCFNWVLDYVSMRLLSLTQFIWRPSVPQLCCSGTHRINTRSNVTVPDVSVFHHKESIVFQLGAWLCKHETALPHTIHLETICPPVVLLWHSQNQYT